MKPADTLRREAATVKELAEAMEGMADAMERGEHVPRHDVERAADAATGYADLHHAKEERVVFPLLGTLAPSAQEGARAMQRDERDALEVATHLRADATAGESDDAAARRVVAEEMRHYARLQRDRLELEMRHVVPLVERMPGQPAIAEAITRVEREAPDFSGGDERSIRDLHHRYARGTRR